MFPGSLIPRVIRNPRFLTAYFSFELMAPSIAGGPRNAFVCCGSSFSKPSPLPGAPSSAASTAPQRRCVAHPGSGCD